MTTGTYSEKMQKASGWLGWVEADSWITFIAVDGRTARFERGTGGGVL